MRSTTAWSSGLREIETDLQYGHGVHPCPVTLVVTTHALVTEAAIWREVRDPRVSGPAVGL